MNRFIVRLAQSKCLRLFLNWVIVAFALVFFMWLPNELGSGWRGFLNAITIGALVWIASGIVGLAIYRAQGFGRCYSMLVTGLSIAGGFICLVAAIEFYLNTVLEREGTKDLRVNRTFTLRP